MSRRAVARAIQKAIGDRSDSDSRQHQLAEVTEVKTSPAKIRINLMDDNRTLDDDQFDMSQRMDEYHADYGLDEGDTVVVHRVSGHWVVVDVLADKVMKDELPKRLKDYVDDQIASL